MARYTPPGSLNSVLAINAELEKISEAFQDTVSRKNDSPNQMEGDLDLNGNSLLNVQSSPDKPNSVVFRKEVYTKEETDELLEENREYTDVREANIRADFSEGITGATVVVYPDVASLEASEPTQTGQRAEVVETGGQYITADVSYTPIAGDYTAGNGRIWRLVGGSVKTDLTVGIPSDFDTLQDAVNYYHNRVRFVEGFSLILNIGAGHQPSIGVSVSNGDYSYIRITSDDTEVPLAPSFTGSFIVGSNCNMPRLECLINAGGYCENGYYAENSRGFVLTGCGVKNAGFHGLYANSASNVVAGGSIFTGASQSTPAYSGILSWGSTVDAYGADVSGSLYYGAQAAAGGSLYFRDGIANNCARHAVRATNLALTVARDVSALNAGVTGVRAFDGGMVHADGIDVSGSVVGFWAENKSEIHCKGSTCNNTSGLAMYASGTSKIYAEGFNGVDCVAGLSSISSHIDVTNCVFSTTGATLVTVRNAGKVIAEACDMSHNSTSVGVDLDEASEFLANAANIDVPNARLLQAAQFCRINLSRSTCTYTAGNGINLTSGCHCNVAGSNILETDVNGMFFNTVYGRGICYG